MPLQTQQTQRLSFMPVSRVRELRNPSATSLFAGVGNTPLFRLQAHRKRFPGADIMAKAEWMNAGGSVKDRAAAHIIRIAEGRGSLKPHHTLLDSSSGNFGTSLAMIGTSRGYRVTLCVPSSVPEERKRILSFFGAKVVFTDPALGSDGAIIAAKELARLHPERYFYTDQYSNPANWQAHYLGTAEEIWRQSGGEITHFVAGLGSSGTFTGIAKRLRELDSDIRCVAVVPDCARHGLRGMKHMESAIRPAIYDESVADEHLPVNTGAALDTARALAREEGMFVGVTSGAAMAGCLDVARRSSRPVRIVTLFPDTGMNCVAELAAGARP